MSNAAEKGAPSNSASTTPSTTPGPSVASATGAPPAVSTLPQRPPPPQQPYPYPQYFHQAHFPGQYPQHFQYQQGPPRQQQQQVPLPPPPLPPMFFGLTMPNSQSPELMAMMMQRHHQQQQQQAQQQIPITTPQQQHPMHSNKGPKKPPPQQQQRVSSKKKRKISKKRRDSTTRTLPRVRIQDDDPTRLVNPLLELPYYTEAFASSELHTITDLVYHKPDTFPLVYYARLLGFHDDCKTREALNPATILLLKDASIYQVPPLGTWYTQVQRNNSFDKLAYMDPMYKALLQKVPAVLVPATTVASVALNANLLESARKSGLLHADRDVFSTSSTPEKGLFTLSLGTVSCLYDFSWYPIEDDEETTTTTTVAASYGISSAALHLKKPQVSELVLNVHNIELKNQDTSLLSTTDWEKQQRQHVLVVLASVLEHARLSSVWYAVLHVPEVLVELLQEHFFAKPVSSERVDLVALLCDLHQCSYRYAFLSYQEKEKKQQQQQEPTTRQRMLVRLPTAEEVVTGIGADNTRAFSYASAKQAVRPIAFGIRLSLKSSFLQVLNPKGEVVETATNDAASVTEQPPTNDAASGTQQPSTNDAASATQQPPTNDAASGTQQPPPTTQEAPPAQQAPPSAQAAPTTKQLPSWQVLKSFAQVVAAPPDEDDILKDLREKQSELAALESGLEPKLRSMLQQVVDIRMDYERNAPSREAERKTLKAYEGILERRKELDSAWQKQLEQDMDAVCDICRDGEVTPDNQILFCEACNVAVHQMCYGIDEVPEGDYYCIACRHFHREKISEAISRQVERGGKVNRIASAPLPICCELCPQKQGAFVRSDTSQRKPNEDGSAVLSKWVHVVCAKWQGLTFVPPGQKEVVEDVLELKQNFLMTPHKCSLCLGKRGAYVKCRDEGCDSWMHVTCARATGRCEVVHGENCHGPVEKNPWSLLCPEHSSIDPDSVSTDRVSIDQLVRAANEFPPEPVPEAPKPKPAYHKMNGKERRKFWADPENEAALVRDVSKKLHGVHCEVCNQCELDGKNLTRCCSCDVVFCTSCMLPCDFDKDGKDYKCLACQYVDRKKKAGEEFEEPHCHMCFQKGGWLRKGYAEPVNKKSFFKKHPEEFAKTLFAKDLWCHTICTMWHPKVAPDNTGQVNCESIIMSNGLGHILGNVKCGLCGDTGGLKVTCSEKGCRAWGEKSKPYNFHVTCAREAGLEVQDKLEEEEQRFYFDVRCFRHSGNGCAFRARLEDLIELERIRSGMRFEKIEQFTSYAHTSRLFNKAIIVMKMLGWAWRWAEWWVEYGDNWEPLLEEGQVESEMTKEQLKIVDTTRESRCEAARKCRLAAFGAALRNRDYDHEEGDDRVALDRALRAVLHTPPLVGPLEPFEIDFFAEWLGRAYRSKSRLLGFGEDKIPIKPSGSSLHMDDKSPKFILGSRRLPGKQELPEGAVFETDIVEARMEVDDFLKPEMFPDGTLVTAETLKPRKRPKQDEKQQSSKKGSRRGRKSSGHDGAAEDKSVPSAKATAGENESPLTAQSSMDYNEMIDEEEAAASVKGRSRKRSSAAVSSPLSASEEAPRNKPSIGKKPGRRGRPPAAESSVTSDKKPGRRGRPPAAESSVTSDKKPGRRGRPPAAESSVTLDKKPGRRGRPPAAESSVVVTKKGRARIQRGRTSLGSADTETPSSPAKGRSKKRSAASAESQVPKKRARHAKKPSASKQSPTSERIQTNEEQRPYITTTQVYIKSAATPLTSPEKRRRASRNPSFLCSEEDVTVEGWEEPQEAGVASLPDDEYEDDESDDDDDLPIASWSKQVVETTQHDDSFFSDREEVTEVTEDSLTSFRIPRKAAHRSPEMLSASQRGRRRGKQHAAEALWQGRP